MNIEKENARSALLMWQESLKENLYQNDPDFKHSISLYLANEYPHIDKELGQFAEKIVKELEPLVKENNLAQNLPRIDHYDALGHRIEQIVHHPTYEAAGNIIYGSRLLERLSKPGGLLEALAFMFLSSQAGEAGHNCPVACSAGIIRIFQKVEDFPKKNFYFNKLIEPSYTNNFTGAQFLTEIQGGSDVGQNMVEARQDEQNRWRIYGEKWFCSNADAELCLVTARFDQAIVGTKGLGLFLVPALLESGERNHYTLRRLKDKIGTQSMATGEIDFNGAYAIAMGDPANGFKMVMENVLHLSRIFNAFCVLGMARRAFYLARSYAEHRIAFDHPIIQYPLVIENLARIKAENTGLLASIFAATQLQDDCDTGKVKGEDTKLLLRLLINLNKYLSALWSVEHIHHALDVLAGNGTIESFSAIPRLFRDSIVCENWEGTHNTLRMQILKDIERHRVDHLFLQHLETLLSYTSLDEEYLLLFQERITNLKNDLVKLKSASLEIQSLQIKSIVDQMIILFAAVCLGIEAADQSKEGQFSKKNCLDYFLLLHVKKHEIIYDQHYLNLINGVVAK